MKQSSSPVSCNCSQAGFIWHVIAFEIKNLSNGREFIAYLSQLLLSIGTSFIASSKDVQTNLIWIIAVPGNSTYCSSCIICGLIRGSRIKILIKYLLATYYKNCIAQALWGTHKRSIILHLCSRTVVCLGTSGHCSEFAPWNILNFWGRWHDTQPVRYCTSYQIKVVYSVNISLCYIPLDDLLSL